MKIRKFHKNNEFASTDQLHNSFVIDISPSISMKTNEQPHMFNYKITGQAIRTKMVGVNRSN